MRLLLDTHVLVWAVGSTRHLDAETLNTLGASANVILFSAASIWEIAIKRALRRPDFTIQPQDILRAAIEIGFVEIPVTSATAAQVTGLPLIHRDPFDRILIAQAIAEPAVFYTADTRLAAYSDLVRGVPAR